ncbi:MAG: TolC family protein [Myxococcales bacterium]
MIPTLALGALLAAPPRCPALDLPRAIQLAVQRSDEVAIRKAELFASEADLSLARAAQWIPQASATLIGGPAPDAHGNVVTYTGGLDNRTFSQLGPFGRIDASVVQPLWTWGQLSAAREAARAGVSARTLLVHDQEAKVVLRVVQLYWGAALARRLLDIAADVEGALDKADKTIAEGIASGESNLGLDDKYRVALFRGQLGSKRADAKQGLSMARAGLAATLAMAEPELALAEEPLPREEPPPLPSAAEALDLAERRRPDLRALDQAVLASDQAVEAARGALYPQVFAAGTFTYAYAPNRTIQLDPWVYDPFNTLQAGIVLGLQQNLSFPLLLSKVKKAQADLAVAQRQRQGLARLVQAEVGEALAEANAALEKERAAKAALGAGKAWFRSTEMNFGVGVASGRDLIDAYTGFVQSQVDMAQAQYELRVSRAHLDQVTGVLEAPRGETTCSAP